MSLVHFARRPLAGGIESVEQTPEGSQKPRGLWVSDESQHNGWRWWCEGMGWDDRIAYAYAVTLAADARILRLPPHELEDFAREYGVVEPWMQHFDYPVTMRIDWARVAEQWQGVLLTPYDRESASLALMWAYSFDCASGCIWDAAAIASMVEDSSALRADIATAGA